MPAYGVIVPLELASGEGPFYLIGVKSSFSYGDQIEFGPMKARDIPGICMRAIDVRTKRDTIVVFARNDLRLLIDGLTQVYEDMK
jgi:hypothetical protein